MPKNAHFSLCCRNDAGRRDGYDETMTIDLDNLRMLYQGRDPAIRANYGLLPYRLGLLKRDQSGNPNPTTERMP